MASVKDFLDVAAILNDDITTAIDAVINEYGDAARKLIKKLSRALAILGMRAKRFCAVVNYVDGTVVKPRKVCVTVLRNDEVRFIVGSSVSMLLRIDDVVDAALAGKPLPKVLYTEMPPNEVKKLLFHIIQVMAANIDEARKILEEASKRMMLPKDIDLDALKHV